MDSKAEYSA